MDGLDIPNMKKYLPHNQIKDISKTIKDATIAYCQHQRTYKAKIGSSMN